MSKQQKLIMRFWYLHIITWKSHYGPKPIRPSVHVCQSLHMFVRSLRPSNRSGSKSNLEAFPRIWGASTFNIIPKFPFLALLQMLQFCRSTLMSSIPALAFLSFCLPTQLFIMLCATIKTGNSEGDFFFFWGGTLYFQDVAHERARCTPAP